MKTKINKVIKKIILDALKEDLPKGDITSNTLVSKNEISSASIIAKNNGILCGLSIVKETFKQIDSSIKLRTNLKDGTFIKKNQRILFINGKKISILKAERTALNFLSFLSSISTKTNSLKNKIKKFNTKICCTRKTLPNLRKIQKYAVLIGGGTNNRMSLSDEIFIKDNHFAGKLDFRQVVIKSIKKNRNKKIITVEIDNISQLKIINDLKINRILFDNMSTKQIKQGLKIIPKRIETEASGNINENNILSYAKSGVSRISMGNLTHTIDGFDFSLDIIDDVF